MTKLEYVKENLDLLTKAELLDFLEENNLKNKRNNTKIDYVNAVLDILNEDNIDNFIDMTNFSIPIKNAAEILNLSETTVRTLSKKGHLHVSKKITNLYGQDCYLYNLSEVYNCIGLIQPRKRKNIEILRDIPQIMDYYPDARKLHRKFYIHVGGTNTGKTYSSLIALKQCQKGVYLGPLRLLAIEICDQLNHEHYPCSLLTGEEEEIKTDALFESRTVEKADIKTHYEVAVIDECQMLGDKDRGVSWTRAVMGVCADEIHTIVAPEGLSILIKLIDACGDEYEIIQHERKVPLIVEKEPFSQIQDNDALIVFSRNDVLALASELEKEGIPASIIYGSLPYSVRIKEAEKFRNGETKVVIATDAIGMGLNLPIKRVVFMENQKYDGAKIRPLYISEVKQIAGRAGRFGMFDTGYVSCSGDFADLKKINEKLNMETPVIRSAAISFPEELLQKKYAYGRLLISWHEKAILPSPFVKKDISRELAQYKFIRDYEFPNDTVHKLCNIPFDETNEELENLWKMLVHTMYMNYPILDLYPNCGSIQNKSLEDLETLYKAVDLFYSFSKTMGYDIESKQIQEDRDRISLQIMELLKEKKTRFMKKCCKCGKPLHWNDKNRYCDICFDEIRNKYFNFYGEDNLNE